MDLLDLKTIQILTDYVEKIAVLTFKYKEYYLFDICVSCFWLLQVLRILEGNFLVEKLDNGQEQSTTTFLKPSLESYNSSTDRLSMKLEKRQYQKPTRALTKLSSIALRLENHQDTISKPTTSPPKHVTNDEYQEYLQGSFQKHIQRLTLNMKL